MRLPDWKQRLIAYLEDCVRRPFQFGRHDCALFAAGAVQAMTGTDPAADWRGRYRTLKGGLKAVRRAGYADHIALAAAVLPEVHPAFAAPGDLAVIGTPDGPALGVVQGEGVYVLGPDRIGLVSMGDAVRAFKVA
jgi:hypothetical protein